MKKRAWFTGVLACVVLVLIITPIILTSVFGTTKASGDYKYVHKGGTPYEPPKTTTSYVPYIIALCCYGTLILLLYFCWGYFMFRIAKKLDVPNAWYSWIPIINLYLMAKLAGKEDAEFWLSMFGGILSFGLILIIFMVVWWVNIARRMDTSPVIGAFAPFTTIGLPFMCYVAFGNPKQEEPIAIITTED